MVLVICLRVGVEAAPATVADAAATYAHWVQETADMPELTRAYERLVQDGIVSRVQQPSPNHLTRHFPQPKNCYPPPGDRPPIPPRIDARGGGC